MRALPATNRLPRTRPLRPLRGASALVLLCVVMSPLASAQEKPSPLTLPTPTDQPATLTFEQLRDGIKQGRKDLWALEAEYEYRCEKRGIPWAKFHFAMKGEKRLRDQEEAGGRLYGNTYNEKDAQVWDRRTKVASVERKKETWADLDFYADAIGVGVSDEDRAKGTSLTAALDNPELEWTVQPTLDTVDGARCHVLVSKGFKNRVWVDPAIGFAERFQEVYQPIKAIPKADWPLAARYSYRDFENVLPGVYLPKKIEIVAYANSNGPRSLWNQATFTQVMSVTKVAAGPRVEDGLFRYTFSPGTTVMDRTNGRFYRVGKSGEELDMLVGKGLQELRKGTSHTRSRLVLIGNGIFVVAVIAWVAYRRRQGRLAGAA